MKKNVSNLGATSVCTQSEYCFHGFANRQAEHSSKMSVEWSVSHTVIAEERANIIFSQSQSSCWFTDC